MLYCIFFHNSQCQWQSRCLFLVGMKMSSLEESQSHVNPLSYIPPYTSLHSQVSSATGCLCCRRLHGLYLHRLYLHLLAQIKFIVDVWQISINSCSHANLSLRYQLTCFLRTEEIGGATHHLNSNMFHLHTRRCSMVRVTTSQRSAALGRAHTQKMVSGCVTFRFSRQRRN